MKWIRKQIYWIASIVVGGMILWLITTAVTIRYAQAESAGTLFGRSVPLADYVKAAQAVMHKAILTHGDRYRQSVSEKEMEEQTWERLLFLSEAQRKGIRVSDREVVQELQAIPLFQREGRFDSPGYQAIMQYTLGTTPRAFEEETREDLTIQKMIQQVIGTSAVTEKELKERFQQRGGAMKIEFLTLPDPMAGREIADACRQQPEELTHIAKRNNLKITATDFFERDGPAAGVENPASLFGRMSGLKPGETAGPFKSAGGWIVAQLKERKPPEEKDFAADRADLEKEIAAQKRLQNYLAWYQDLMKRAKPQRKALPRPGR